MSHEEKGYSPDKGAEKTGNVHEAGGTVRVWKV